MSINDYFPKISNSSSSGASTSVRNPLTSSLPEDADLSICRELVEQPPQVNSPSYYSSYYESLSDIFEVGSPEFDQSLLYEELYALIYQQILEILEGIPLALPPCGETTLYDLMIFHLGVEDEDALNYLTNTFYDLTLLGANSGFFQDFLLGFSMEFLL